MMQRLEDNECHNMSGLVHEAHEKLISVQTVHEIRSCINCWTELQETIYTRTVYKRERKCSIIC